jgi:lysophosphatidylcholine acyltransferase/lyso-PAF acetyltransferase
MDTRPRLHSFQAGFLADDGSDEAITPFFNKTVRHRLPLLEKIKRVITCCTLVPIRIVCIILILLLGGILTKIATIGLSKDAFHPLTGRPLSGWRYAVFTFILNGRWMLLWSFGFMCVRTKGRQASQQEAPIVVANHVCGLIEGMYLLRCATMVEAHYLTNPLLGPIMMATSSIFVDRADPQSREVAKQALKRRAQEPDWPKTLVFPEGTCTNGSALVQFKLGAFAAGVPVQPVVFRYPNRHHDVSFTFPVTSLGYALGMIMQCVNRMEVEFLDVYVPSELEQENPAIFASGVQRRMAEALGVPATKHAAEDVALCLQAQRLHMPLETGLVKWQQIQENLTGVNVRHAKTVLKEFQKLDQAGQGRIDFQMFATAMEALHKQDNPDAEMQLSREDLQCVFQLLDVSGDGFVNFQEYFCGVAILAGHGKDEEEALKWTFECLAHGENFFTKEQLAKIISRTIPTVSAGQLDSLFAEADADNDGRISRQEFIAFAKQHQQDLRLRPSVILAGVPLAFDPGRLESAN